MSLDSWSLVLVSILKKTKDIIIANFEALGLNGAVFTAGKRGKLPYGQIKKYYRGNDVVINPGIPTTTNTGKRTEDLQFYYHPDHLGSSNYITDVSGEVYQHEEYFPFGETFVEERNDSEYTTYLFNGKELDEETGLYYYGARYYDPRVSVFYGVDPLAEKLPHVTPYIYCIDNPVKLKDPDGQFPVSTHVDIMKKAMGKFNLPLKVQSNDDVYGMIEIGLITGVKNADNIGFAADNHFDNRTDFTEVSNGWDNLSDGLAKNAYNP